jgi:hypothetical protein
VRAGDLGPRAGTCRGRLRDPGRARAVFGSGSGRGLGSGDIDRFGGLGRPETESVGAEEDAGVGRDDRLGRGALGRLRGLRTLRPEVGVAADLQEHIQGPGQRAAAGGLVPPHPLALDAAVEGQPGGLIGGVGLGPRPVRRGQGLQPRLGPRHDSQEDRPRGGGVGRGQVLHHAALGQPVLVDDRLAAEQLALELGEDLCLLAAEQVGGQEDGGDLGVVGGVQRLLAQQPDRLELVGRLPGQLALQQVAEPGPAVQQPAAAGSRGLEARDQPGGIIRVVGQAGGGDPRLTGTVLEVGIQRQGPARVPQEPAAQRGGLLRLAELVLHRRVAEGVGHPGRLGAAGAVELPGGLRRLLGQALLQLVARLEDGGEGVEPGLVGLGILAGQDGGPSRQAVLQRIEARTALALGRPGPGAAGGIAAVDGGAVGRVGRRGHGGLEPRCRMGAEGAVQAGLARA